MLKHPDWLESISKTVLAEVAVSLEDYIDTITSPGVPLDFIAVTVLCRAYHMHIGIFTAAALWTTSKVKSFEVCKFALVFHGDLQFSETVQEGQSESYLQWIEDRTKKGLMPSHIRTCVPGQIKLEPKLEAVPQLLGLKYEYVSEPEMPSDNEPEDTDVAEVISQDRPEPDIEEIISCPACEFTDKTQKNINCHVKTTHPDFRYSCSICDKTFGNYSTKFKHDKEHTSPSHFCGECGKGFHYSSELQRHSPVHSTVLPYGCQSCDKRYAQKKSLTRHERSHNPQIIKCSECDKVVDTEERLYSHFRGAHGRGYDAPCGENFQWPGTRSRHQRKCDKCKAILAKRREQKLSIARNVQVRCVKVEQDVKIKKEHLEKVKTELEDRKAKVPKLEK